MKLKVALLEDDREILKALRSELEATGLVEVIFWAQNSAEFLQKIASYSPEAVILDIDLAGDSKTGLEVAQQVKLPVMFVSGKTRDFFSAIEEMNISMEFPVEHLTKPIWQDKLARLMPKFIDEINSYSQKRLVYLNFKESRRNKISTTNIVYLCADKDFGSESNNKRIFFSDRKPEILNNFSFKSMVSAGFSMRQFVTTHKSFVVNADHIIRYVDSEHVVEVNAIADNGKMTKFVLPVSENYRKLLMDRT